MNRLGGKSNSGEGGERPRTLRHGAHQRDQAGRLGPLRRDERISGRRRRDPDQNGAGRKARRGRPSCRATRSIRGSQRRAIPRPGVALISPPPHHDIYSIEDLAQLIYDLEKRQPRCAHFRQTRLRGGSRHDRRGRCEGRRAGRPRFPATTAARAPLRRARSTTRACRGSSGLAEAHQTLIHNGLRTRVRLRDGRQADERPRRRRSPRILGAEEFGFATAPLVTHGLRDDARVQPGHLPRGHRHAEPRAAQAFLRQARIRA